MDDLKFCPHCLMPTTATSGRTEMPTNGIWRAVQAECVRGHRFPAASALDAQPTDDHPIQPAHDEDWPNVFCRVREFEGQSLVDVSRSGIGGKPSSYETVTMTLNQFYEMAAFVAARVEGDKQAAQRKPPADSNMQNVHNADEQQPPHQPTKD